MAMLSRLKRSWPLWVTFIVAGAYIVARLAVYDWNVVALAEIGTQFSEGDPAGTEGYDGQFTYYIAVDLNPATVSDKLDVPAYRYQRILLPALAHFFTGGHATAIPWALLAINLLAQLAGTYAVMRYLQDCGLRTRYALSYGLWVGLVSAVGLQLHEPLAYGLAALAWLARKRGKSVLSAVLIGLALFAKETILIIWLALFLSDLIGKRRWKAVLPWIVVGVLYAGWQVWLWRVFGAPGIGSGGAKSTPFEWIPLMGLWRIGFVSLPALGLFIVIFGPTIFLPAIWGIWVSARELWRRRIAAENVNLLINGMVILFLPYSTIREPLGLLRFASGFVLAVLLFAARNNLHKPLNYSLLWIPLIAVLLNG
jgi:hypothetical protein